MSQNSSLTLQPVNPHATVSQHCFCNTLMSDLSCILTTVKINANMQCIKNFSEMQHATLPIKLLQICKLQKKTFNGETLG